MFHKVWIHLVIILTSILAVSSSNSGNRSFNLQEEHTLQRIRRDIYEDQYDDQYEDEYESINDENVRRNLESLQLADDNSDEGANILQPPVKGSFVHRRILDPTGTSKPPEANVSVIQPPGTKKSPPEGPGYPVAPPVGTRGIFDILMISYRLRQNILHIFGCLLQRPVDFLTESQYTSLYTIYTELRNRPSYINLVLREIKTVPTNNLNEQMKSIMQILGEVLPSYLGCAANFWVREIEQRSINFSSMPADTCPSNFNILKDINVHLIKLHAYMTPMDGPTRMTEIVLGKIFVKIMYDIQRLKVTFTQKMFGFILSFFPIIPYDPVLEENIRYIFEITLKNGITGWTEVESHPILGDPYLFVRTIIAKILIIHNVPRSIKEALTYIWIHLRPVNNYHANPEYPILISINDHVHLLKMLLSFIVPNAYSPETICLKERFLQYVEDYSFTQSMFLTNIERIRYTNPHDLLLAYLTKLQRHVPNPDSEKARTVTALLSVLIIDQRNKQFTPVSKNIDFFSILGYLSNPDFPEKVNIVYKKILYILLNKPDLQRELTKLVPTEKGKCIVIDECLKEILKNLDKMNMEIPRRMEKHISELNDMIPIQATDPKCRTSTANPPDNVVPVISDEPVPDKPADSGSINTGDPGNNQPAGGSINIGNPGNNQPAGGSINIGNPGNNQQDSGPTKIVNPGNNNSGGVTINNYHWITNILLPPMMSPTQDISIYINQKGALAVDCPNVPLYPGNPKVTMPPIVVLLKPTEVSDPFGSMNQEFKTNILLRITQIIGSSDLTVILGTSVPELITSGQCPTIGALVVTLLFQAQLNTLVQTNHQLITDIKSFLSAMDLVAVITLPIVLQVTGTYPTNGIIFSVIDIAQPHRSSISVTTPSNVPRGMLVFVIVDPNKLREPVDPQNPYEGLLPNVGSETPGGQFILQLRLIVNTQKISQLIPNFKPATYSSKGMLLVILLQKLPNVPEIAAQPHLKKIILGYIWAILIPTFYQKIAYNELLVLLGHQPTMIPNTMILLNLLPPPTTEREQRMFLAMKILLERKDLFEIILMPKPTPNTSQKELLQIIILGVLSSPGTFDESTVSACEFYKKQLSDIKKVDSDILWEFETRESITTDPSLGKILENVINYDKLSNGNKDAYNKLITYFEENKNIFSLSQDFHIKDYTTEGSFIVGFLNFVMEKPIVSQQAKNYINALLPHVMLEGPGAKPLKIITQGNPPSGRRSLSKFEISI
ncbi:uncharacterized protein LOC117179575 [Belonocnema kinseyi]|uniref:uncharacterized protein LOC117179575 n=1 Tax=Belonocnema kinseyi TaxID=2817044 RepID=UPI00143DDA9D|nr:uncharacterized protein LOC117179575 [Belonocnema kinseyi]